MNFVICGLPRSGTTIVARFVGALPGVAVAHEPLQTYAKLKCMPPWPLDAQHVGLKEPFWPVWGVYINESTLRFFHGIGWKFIWVVRWGIRDALARRRIAPAVIDQIIPAFEDFRNNEPAIVYEDFCADPVGTWNKLNPLGVLATEVALAKCPDAFMGDWRAYNSEKIERLH